MLHDADAANPGNYAGYSHERNWACRLNEFTWRGLKTVVLENELLRISVLADKGTDIFEFLYKPQDVDFMWRSPFPLRNPALFVPTVATGAGAFHDNYEGGWQEIFPTGGPPTHYKGADFGYHGEVSLIPWRHTIIDDRPERVAVRFQTRTYRTPFLVEKELSLERGKALLRLKERVVNEGFEEMELMWGHHPAIGPAFLDPTCRIDLPGGRVLSQRLGDTSRMPAEGNYEWPLVPDEEGKVLDLSRVPGPEVRAHDVAYIYDLPERWYAIRSVAKRLGFAMRWSAPFDYLWFWQVYRGAGGYNLYGRSYHLALEPWSSIPGNFDDARERRSTLSLAPGNSLEAELSAIVFTGNMDPVRSVGPQGEIIQ